MDRQPEAPTRSDEQREAERLIEEAKRLPGVEDMLAVYAQIEPYTLTGLPKPALRLAYALGGNA